MSGNIIFEGTAYVYFRTFEGTRKYRYFRTSESTRAYLYEGTFVCTKVRRYNVVRTTEVPSVLSYFRTRILFRTSTTIIVRVLYVFYLATKIDTFESTKVPPKDCR